MPAPSTIPKSIREHPWQWDCTIPEQGSALQTVQQFGKLIVDRQPARWLSLLGPSGRGKTHLAKSLWRWHLGKYPSRSARFCRWMDVVNRCRNGETYALMESLEDRDFLVVDDIGAEHGSEFASSLLTQLAERRLRKWTVYTANLSVRDLAQIDARVASRLRRDGNAVFTFQDSPDFSLAESQGLA